MSNVNVFTTNFPAITLSVGDLSIDPSLISRIEIRQDLYQHDMATIELTKLDETKLVALAQQPAILGWKAIDQEYRYLAGYSHKVSPTHSPKTRFVEPSVTIKLLGASSHMGEEHSRIYRNRNVPSILEEIATEQNFYFEGDPSDTVWDSVSQVGISDWKFMVELAQKIGYSLTVDNTVVRLTDPRTALARSGAYLPVYVYGEHLISFEMNGSTSSVNRDFSDYEVSYMNPVSKQTGYARSSHLDERFGFGSRAPYAYRTVKRYTETAGSYDEALAMVRGLSILNSWTLQGNAVMRGNNRLRPGRALVLRGVGTEYSGPWYIMGCHHVITPTNYTMSASLGRDGSSYTDFIFPAPTYRRTSPGSVLLNGEWRSERSA